MDILEWLAPGKYGLQQSDYFDRRQSGTGQWLLESAEFQEWIQTSKQTIFCQGISGAGKTILTSIVINDLYKRFDQDRTVGIAYIYCDYRNINDQKVNDLLASLLRQLSERQVLLPGIVKDLYNSHRVKNTRPSLERIYDVLQSVAQNYSKVFLVIDALDECQVSDNNRKKFLTKIFALQNTTRAKSSQLHDMYKIFETSLMGAYC